jgi:hypothetical protein
LSAKHLDRASNSVCLLLQFFLKRYIYINQLIGRLSVGAHDVNFLTHILRPATLFGATVKNKITGLEI